MHSCSDAPLALSIAAHGRLKVLAARHRGRGKNGELPAEQYPIQGLN